MMTPPSGEGVIKLSCFSAVLPVSGWNQWVKCVAPFSTAHSFMASATALATAVSSVPPSYIVFFSETYTSYGSFAFITRSSNTRLPKYSGTVLMHPTPLSEK